MDRDLSRGIRIDNGEWVIGHFVSTKQKHGYQAFIIPIGHCSTDGITPKIHGLFEVIPETVGIYWKDDKDGNGLFVGDKVGMHAFLFDGNEVEKESKAIVGFDEQGYTLEFYEGDFIKEYTGEDNPIVPVSTVYGLHEESFERIGNIHVKGD